MPTLIDKTIICRIPIPNLQIYAGGEVAVFGGYGERRCRGGIGNGVFEGDGGAVYDYTGGACYGVILVCRIFRLDGDGEGNGFHVVDNGFIGGKGNAGDGYGRVFYRLFIFWGGEAGQAEKISTAKESNSRNIGIRNFITVMLLLFK